MDLVRNVVALIDNARIANHALKLKNPSFDERLLLLGILVLRIFGDIAELFGLANPLVDFSTMDGFELIELSLELFEPVARQYDLFFVQSGLLGNAERR